MSRFSKSSTPRLAILTDGPAVGGDRRRLARALLAVGVVLSLAVLTSLSLTAGSAPAAFPGDNGRIACAGVRGTGTDLEIFSVNPDGSGETVLTDNTVRDGSPAYSPDGTKIAFESQRHNVPGEPLNTEIYVANNDGDLEGPDVKRLTFNRGERTGSSLSAIAATDFSPSWSPDGTQIVFHSGRETTFSDGGPSPATDFEIYKMSAATGEESTPAQRLTTTRGQDAIPSWSPDGSKIAFQGLHPANAGTHGQDLEVYTMNPDGTGVTNVSNSPGTPNNPATPANENSNALDRDVIWSPDSSQLAFSSTRDNVTPGNQNFEVYKMRRDGSDQQRLTSNVSGDTPSSSVDYDAPTVWSPDGRRLLFTSGRTSNPAGGGGTFVAFTMDAAAGEPAGLQRVAETAQFLRCDWQRLRQFVTVTKAGSGQGSVTSTPAGIDCGAVCSKDFATGAQVTLTATPAAGSTFSGFSGEGCSGTATSCTVTLDQARFVTATFEADLDADGVIDANDACPTRSDAGRPLANRNGCPDDFKPVLSDLRPRPRTFEAANTGASIAAIGTNIRYRLSEAASVRFTVDRTLPGRRELRSGPCLRPTRGNRSGRPCLRYVAFRVGRSVPSFVDTGTEGFNTFRFTGRLGGRKLDPGRYRLAGVATDLAGNQSRVKRALFRIVD